MFRPQNEDLEKYIQQASLLEPKIPWYTKDKDVRSSSICRQEIRTSNEKRIVNPLEHGEIKIKLENNLEKTEKNLEKDVLLSVSSCRQDTNSFVLNSDGRLVSPIRTSSSKSRPSRQNAGRSKSPVSRSNERPRSPTDKLKRRSRSPVSRSVRSKSPISRSARAKSPVSRSKRSKSPVSRSRKSKSPVSRSKRSKSPVIRSKKTRSPNSMSKRSKSPMVSKSPIKDEGGSNKNSRDSKMSAAKQFDDVVNRLILEAEERLAAKMEQIEELKKNVNTGKDIDLRCNTQIDKESSSAFLNDNPARSSNITFVGNPFDLSTNDRKENPQMIGEFGTNFEDIFTGPTVLRKGLNQDHENLDEIDEDNPFDSRLQRKKAKLKPLSVDEELDLLFSKNTQDSRSMENPNIDSADEDNPFDSRQSLRKRKDLHETSNELITKEKDELERKMSFNCKKDEDSQSEEINQKLMIESKKEKLKQKILSKVLERRLANRLKEKDQVKSKNKSNEKQEDIELSLPMEVLEDPDLEMSPFWTPSKVHVIDLNTKKFKPTFTEVSVTESLLSVKDIPDRSKKIQRHPPKPVKPVKSKTPLPEVPPPPKLGEAKPSKPPAPVYVDIPEPPSPPRIRAGKMSKMEIEQKKKTSSSSASASLLPVENIELPQTSTQVPQTITQVPRTSTQVTQTSTQVSQQLSVPENTFMKGPIPETTFTSLHTSENIFMSAEIPNNPYLGAQILNNSFMGSQMPEQALMHSSWTSGTTDARPAILGSGPQMESTICHRQISGTSVLTGLRFFSPSYGNIINI